MYDYVLDLLSLACITRNVIFSFVYTARVCDLPGRCKVVNAATVLLNSEPYYTL